MTIADLKKQVTGLARFDDGNFSFGLKQERSKAFC